MLLKQTSFTRTGMSRINQSTIINLIGIKCAQCNLIYPQQMIEQHLITHIQPKYLMPHLQKTGAKKLKTKIQLTQQTLSIKSSDIASLNIDTFPKSQTMRKNIAPPSQFGIAVHDLHLVKRDLVSYKNDQRQLSSVIGVRVQKDEVQREKLLHGVGLDREETVLGGRQEISLYRSNRLGGNAAGTQRMKTEKKVNPFQQSTSVQSEKTKQYQILPIKQYSTSGDYLSMLLSTGGLQKQKQQQQQQQLIKDHSLLLVNVRKHKQLTPRHQSIITTSAKKSQQQLQSTASKLFTPTTPNRPQNNLSINNLELQTQHSRFNHTHYNTLSNNLQCEECHGFYCQSCKSTIPAIYRPWNIQDIDPKIVQFYKQHVYKKRCEDCDKNLR